MMRARSGGRFAVVAEAEPREIFEDRALEFEPRALAIVILDAQQHLAVAIARRAPDVQALTTWPRCR
jgi:hypothetical protein